MSIMSYSGGTVLAMAGNHCVCIASDLRIGEQMTTIATNMTKVSSQCFWDAVVFILVLIFIFKVLRRSERAQLLDSEFVDQLT